MLASPAMSAMLVLLAIPRMLALLVPAIWFLGTSYEAATDESALAALDTGDTAWMVVASAFVLLMTPGLAFFYGGLVRSSSVLTIGDLPNLPSRPRSPRT